MARNKLRRFLAGLSTAVMLTQTFWDGSIAVMAAGNGEPVVETVSENEGETDAVSEDAVSVDEADEQSGKVDAAGADEDSFDKDEPAANEDEEDVDPEEYVDVYNKLLVVNGKVYDDVDEDGELDTGETLLGTFDTSTGELVIDADLEYIPSFLFVKWEDLKSLSFAPGSKASTLGHNAPNNGPAGGAFTGCTSLEKVDLSNAPDLTTIKMYAFSGCSALKELVLNDGLQYIEKNAFTGCAIEKVDFGSKLISIDNSAFQDCKSLKEISLSSATTTCGTSVFKGCAIESFTLAKDDKGIVVFPDNLFNGATFKEGAVIDIGADTVEISQGAFQGSNIEHVKLSSKLTVIKRNAFNGCKFLAEIDFTPCKDTLAEIQANAFTSCNSLTRLSLPDKIMMLGDAAFSGCIGVVELKLPAGTQTKDSIGSGVFSRCSSLRSVEFPEGHEYVGASEFSECTLLSDIKFSSTIKEIGANAFLKCYGLTEVVLPTNSAFTVIPSGCFQECGYLQTCEIREGIEEIGNNAFYVCNRFMSSLPSSLKKIGDNAFNSCGFCGTLTLPENLEYIGAGAFKTNRDQWGIRGRQELSVIAIKAVDIPACGKGIFNGCSIREIELQPGVTKIPANLFNQATWITNKVIEIPAEVVEIGDGAFAGNNSTAQNVGNLEKVDFSKCDKLETIGKEAFAYNSVLEDFVLPDSVKTLNDRAFSKCAKLHEIVIPEGVETLGASVFEGCALLEDVEFDAIAVTKSGKNIFKDCNLKNIKIGTKITILPDYLFDGARFQKNTQGNYEMITLTLPASVTKIGISSLTNVVNLKALNFESGSALNVIGQSALSGCVGLESIELPDTVTTIDNYAFQNCTSLTGIDLPKDLTVLGVGAFKGCVKITKAYIPAGVTEVKKEAFCGCIELSDMKFAEGCVVSAIGESAFKGCEKITTVDIPESVKNIGASAFSGCPITGTIKLSEGLTNLGANAFDTAGRDGKTIVYLPKTLRSIGNGAFNIAYKDNLEFHVPQGSQAEKWLQNAGFTGIESSEDVELIKVTFDLNGHGSAISPVEVPKGGKLAEPAAPTAEGWLFGGWFTDKKCTGKYDFNKEVTKAFTLYAKWTKDTEDILGGVSALDPVPEITSATTELWLVKGQKFNIGEGWTVAKADKKYVSISKTGAFKAKKETAGVTISHEGRENIIVHISKPALNKKKLTLTIDSAGAVKTEQLILTKDANIKNTLWYSSSPDVATVDQNGNVTAVGKGTAKVTAYVNGSSYTCSVSVKESTAAAKRTMHLNVTASKSISLKGLKKVTWSSADTSIAALNPKGNKVTAGKAGNTVLSTSVNGVGYEIDFYAEDITVTGEGVAAGKPNKYTVNLAKGGSTDLEFAFVDQAVVFKSSKPDVAFVDENGHVVARSKGTSKLTAKINGKSVTVTVNVSD